MDPLDPLDAQQVVVEYARVLERDLAENRHPARVETLPFATSVIKTAIQTSVTQLEQSGQLTVELREFFETAYVCLAEYLDSELVTLITTYRQSAEELAAHPMAARERTESRPWRTLIESGALAGEIARATTAEAEKLRSEFHGFLSAL